MHARENVGGGGGGPVAGVAADGRGDGGPGGCAGGGFCFGCVEEVDRARLVDEAGDEGVRGVGVVVDVDGAAAG